MNKSDILHLETRRQIYNYIHDNPGLHLREISRCLKMTYYNVNYHVNYLKKLGMISVKKDNYYARMYAIDKVGMFDKKMLNIIQQETPRHILIWMIYTVVCSQKDLSEELDKHPTTIEYHLKKLLELGIIEPAPVKDGVVLTGNPNGKNVDRTPVTCETLYRLKNYPLVAKLGITYRESLFKDKIFKTCYKYIKWANAEHNKIKENKHKNFKTIDWWFDFSLEVFYDIFPHPYHV